jgi:uncharacterized protein (TIGR03435 family)
MWKLTTIVLAMSGLAGVVHGQTPPAFEVASVKPNKSGSLEMHFGIQSDRFTADNATPKELITLAYNVRDLQLVGVPEWVGTDHYDIVAKAYSPLKSGTVPAELKQLLADRFGVRAHDDTRELPIYALVIASADGRLGPGINRIEPDRCPQVMAAAEARARSGQPPPPRTPGQRPSCGLFSNPGSHRGGSIGLGTLANRLASIVGRVVVDRTGLSGQFDFDVTFATETNPNATGPSIFTALQEQLGLKLESTRGPVDVVVIDRVEPPAPD